MKQSSNANKNLISVIFKFIDHCVKVAKASGKKRVAYVFAHWLYLGLAVLTAAASYWLFENNLMILTDLTVIGWVFGLAIALVLAMTTAILVLSALLGQIVLLFASFGGMFKAGQRGWNFLAFILAIASIAGWVFVAAALIKVDVDTFLQNLLTIFN